MPGKSSSVTLRRMRPSQPISFPAWKRSEQHRVENGNHARPRRARSGVMTIQETPKRRNAAWHRAMKGARRDAIGMLDRLGPNADHLPGAAEKAAHKKIVGQLKHVVQ